MAKFSPEATPIAFCGAVSAYSGSKCVDVSQGTYRIVCTFSRSFPPGTYTQDDAHHASVWSA